MDTNKIKAIIVVLLAAFGALYLGIAAATAQVEAISWVLGTFVLAVCIALGRRIWLLMQFLGALALMLYYVPGRPETGQLGQALFLGFSTVLFLMRKLQMRVAFTELEAWCMLFSLCVLQAYMRNPVGLNFLGSANVGGRPYFNFAITFAASYLLSTLIVHPKEIIWLWRVTLLGSLLSAMFATIGYYKPGVGYWLGSSSGEGLSGEDSTAFKDPGMADRKGFAGMIGKLIAQWVGSVKSPLMACLHPVYAPLVLISLAAAAYSGFRNHIAMVGLTYLVAMCYRGGFASVLIASVLGVIGVASISMVNSIIPLPANIQRAMTIFPGSWEERHKIDAEGSTEWRTEMWKEALTNKRYINNTWLGDGLGMTATQLAQSEALSAMKSVTTRSGFNLHRENAMLSGDYHSGPVQTIRTVGYVGLIVLWIALFRLAVHAHRQIIRCRGTEWYSKILFLCIPMIWGPIFWTIIYGTFVGGATLLFTGTALVRLLERNLPLPAYVVRRAEPYLLQKNPASASGG